jgi:hypothetical protein
MYVDQDFLFSFIETEERLIKNIFSLLRFLVS